MSPSSSVDSKANHYAIGTASYLTIVTENTQQAEDGLWVQAILAILQSYMQQENYKFRLKHIMLLYKLSRFPSEENLMF